MTFERGVFASCTTRRIKMHEDHLKRLLIGAAVLRAALLHAGVAAQTATLYALGLACPLMITPMMLRGDRHVTGHNDRAQLTENDRSPVSTAHGYM